MKTVAIFACLLWAGLIHAQQPELVLPTANSNQMQAMAISHNEKMFASADLDGKIKIWEAGSGKLLKTLTRDNIYDLLFTPDDKSLIITSFTPTEIYTIETGKTITLGEQKYCESMDLSPDKKWLAIGAESAIYLWDTKTWTLKEKIASGASNSEVKFSHDSKTIALFGNRIIELWSVDKPVMQKMLRGHTARVIKVEFSKDDKQLFSASDDKTARLWTTTTGEPVFVLADHTNTVWNATYLPDGKRLITVSSDNTAKIWDRATGKLLNTLEEHNDWIYRVRIAPDGKTFAMGDLQGYCTVWDATTCKLLFKFRPGKETLYYLEYLRSGTQLLAGNYDPELSQWNLLTRTKERTFGSHNERLTGIAISHDGKYLATTSRDGAVRKIDVETGRVLFYNKPFKEQWATSVAFSPDDEQIIVAGGRYSTMVLDRSGRVTGVLPDKSSSYESSSKFSPDGKYVLHNDRRSVQVTRMEDNKNIFNIEGISMFSEPRFSPDGQLVIAGGSGTVSVWSVIKEGREQLVNVGTDYPKNIEISAGNKYFLCAQEDAEMFEVWETATAKPVRKTNGTNWASFSDDGKNLWIIYMDGKLALTDIETEQVVKSVQLESFHRNVEFYFTADEKYLIAKSGSNITIWELGSGKMIGQPKGNEIAWGKSFDHFYVLTDDMLEVYKMPGLSLAYRHFIIGENDFLVQDQRGRYDGTEAARKLLYFVCGNEVIELDQAKDQLWIPDLSGRIMKGDSIRARTLDELNICGLTPQVETGTGSSGSYQFKIIPRRGGLGETVVYVNGIEAKRYAQSQLIKNGNAFDLVVKKEEINNLFVSGKENLVTVKAYTTDNAISSRGLIIKEDRSKQAANAPNLYAVIVGVSDYKGDELDLKYAAKDATDISAAVGAASRKLLNTDGKEHVFMYNLITANERYLLPEKTSIKKTLEEIGKKATANDILLVFFAGHGVMSGESGSKQFYFLTADASTLSTTAAVKDVGISTAELVDWMKPQYIKAQKRILIFDACNSGQAINDIAGRELTVRNDDKAQQIKAIDKLNEKAGLFILSASASDQSAYEMGRYSQGILTYALLKAIRLQPDILEDGKYLNVSRWFSAAEKTVTEMARENGARQEPQIVTNTNFNIGLVDAEVISKIILPKEKPLFAASNFQNNDETVADDDLELSKQINLQLNDLATRGKDSRIVYVTATNAPDAYSLSGRYTVKGNELTVTVNIRQNKQVKTKFELKGSKDKLPELAAAIAEKAAGLVN